MHIRAVRCHLAASGRLEDREEPGVWGRLVGVLLSALVVTRSTTLLEAQDPWRGAGGEHHERRDWRQTVGREHRFFFMPPLKNHIKQKSWS